MAARSDQCHDRGDCRRRKNQNNDYPNAREAETPPSDGREDSHCATRVCSRAIKFHAGPEADEAALIELARLDHAESASAVAPFDEQHVRSFIYAATRERIATIGVVDEPEGPVGLVYLTNENWWFSPDWYVAERLLFVHPAHRRSRHSRDLLRFAQWFVDSMTAELGYTVFLISSVVGTKDVDRKAALYGRTMTRGGGIYIHPSPSLVQR